MRASQQRVPNQHRRNHCVPDFRQPEHLSLVDKICIRAADKVLTFVQHNLAGSRVRATGENRWTIRWTAPAPASAPVQFNVAANASNNDDSPLGDYIYLKRIRSERAPVAQAFRPAK